VSLRLETHDLGITWVIDEPFARASHALADAGRVWIIDPVDDPGAMSAAANLGEPAAVVQLLDRHNRDCAAVAERLGVPHLRLPDALPDSPFESLRVISWPVWKEVGLWWPQREALIVAEAIGTSPLFGAGRGPVGVHPFLRLLPPRTLGRYEPTHLLVGHGSPRHGPQTGTEVSVALQRSRRDLPRALAMMPKMRG